MDQVAQVRAGRLMRGEVAYIFAFDVASEIKTARVREVLSARPVPFTLRTDRTTPSSMSYYKPLTIELPPRPGLIGGRDAKIQVRIYDVGALSVILSVPFQTESLSDLLPLHSPVLEGGLTLGELAASIQRQVVDGLAPCLVGPTVPLDPEAYTVFCVTDLGAGQADVEPWLEARRAEVAGLLAETPPDRLSEAQVTETLRISRSYERTDLVVIDWDAALAVDLTGYLEDTLYALEMATIQLEEFKAIDSQLDRFLNRAYEDFESNRRGLLGVTRGTLKALRQIRVDALRLTDEVTHISKFFGDWYLARVYIGARNRFHLDHWKSSVQDRLSQLDQLYSVAQSETNDRRMVLLEATIVLLFVIDIAALFLMGK